MVLGCNPVILLEKLPRPWASLVLLSFTFGFGEVLQHTPLAVTDFPPSFVILPPDTAVVVLTLLTVEVVNVGKVSLLPFKEPEYCESFGF